MTFSRPLWLLLSLSLPLVLRLGWQARATRRGKAALLARTTLLALLILALSGFSLRQPSRRLDVVFVLDWSDSLPDSAKAQALAYVQDALAHKAPEDRAAVLVFGQDALVEHLLSSDTRLESVHSLPNPAHTDLEEALNLAFTLLPAENARRIVVLTDGAYTTGNPQNSADLIRRSGVDLRFVCFPFGQVTQPGDCQPPNHNQPDTAITALQLPPVLHAGETFPLEVTLRTQNAPVSGQLEVRSANGTLLHRQPYTARPGSEHLTLSLTTGQNTGLQSYTVEFIPSSADVFPQNNRLQGYTNLLGQPRLLLVAPPVGEMLPGTQEPRPDEAAALESVLRQAAFQVERVLPGALPASLLHLGRYDALVLVDVPASALSQAQMQAVQQYVRDLGGGLVVIGGPTSFGVGGYYHTPLENALPLEMQIRDEQKRARMAILYVIDRSGSMMESSGGPSKLNLAKEAAIRSVEMLLPGDQVGVVAFDDSVSWVVPLQTLENPLEVQAAISRIASGGGTDIFAGLQAAAQAIPQSNAQVRHIILLTDGQADSAKIPALVQTLHGQENVTLSAIGIGQDAAADLQDWAEMGGGRYYFVDQPERLPDIFAAETALVSRAYLVEETFTPRQSSPSPIVPAGGLPPLHGYVAAQARRTAQVILQSPRDDPVLALWRYGLGKALAFTSDATGRWAADWLHWQGYAAFWDAAVRSVLGSPLNGELQVEVATQGEQARLLVTLLQAAPQGGYDLQASILPPGSSQGQVLPLVQQSANQFSASFTPQEAGVYLVRVQGQTPEGRELSLTTGWSYAYPAEYRPQSASDRLLRLLAQLQPNAPAALLQSQPAQAFAHDLEAPAQVRALWYPLLALAAALLPLDVAIRRLVVGKEEMRLWRMRTRGERSAPQVTRVRTLLRVKQPPPSPPPPAPASRHTAQALLKRKRSRKRPP